MLFKSDWFLLGINVPTSSNFVKDLFILLSFTIYIYQTLYLSFFSLTLATTGVAHWPFGYYGLKFHDFFSNFIPGGDVEKNVGFFKFSAVVRLSQTVDYFYFEFTYRFTS